MAEINGIKDARLLSISGISQFTAGTFDTVLMMGNNFGLFGSRARAGTLLRRLYRIAEVAAVK